MDILDLFKFSIGCIHTQCMASSPTTLYHNVFELYSLCSIDEDHNCKGQAGKSNEFRICFQFFFFLTGLTVLFDFCSQTNDLDFEKCKAVVEVVCNSTFILLSFKRMLFFFLRINFT